MELSEQELTELQAKFPTKDVKFEYEFAQDWLASTGRTNKYKDLKAFFRNWLRRAQDRKVPKPNDTIEKLRAMEISEEQKQKNIETLNNMRKQFFGGKDEN